ncbi:hypothetical protein PGT21_016141 [Puccinia graminis f. sp. tritici]|uniref:Uncharacterized protein n=1 Tax=Puccinia graminis f. sp. tritici TaxID=56615 RepID=A0A5B0S4I4_PUCGR|nr:hypothetical protein PGT21_016141 [Puccinia graminis f. sp. tritici]KAA1132023.1 hypothetical protein PGTUg99_035850 [Puccinia graminis f. sp. tritici]
MYLVHRKVFHFQCQRGTVHSPVGRGSSRRANFQTSSSEGIPSNKLVYAPADDYQSRAKCFHYLRSSINQLNTPNTILMAAYTPADRRDQVYLGFFLIHAISAVCVDIQPLLPQAVQLDVFKRLLDCKHPRSNLYNPLKMSLEGERLLKFLRASVLSEGIPSDELV